MLLSLYSYGGSFHWRYPLSHTTSLFLEILLWAYHSTKKRSESSKIVNYILKILQSSNYRFTLFGSCLSAKAYHIGECNLDFLEISHFLITPMLPIITFWKRDFRLVLVMRDILPHGKLKFFLDSSKHSFFLREGVNVVFTFD